MEIFKEEEISSVAEKVLNKCIGKIKTEITDTFYDEMHSYFYEHYINLNDIVKSEILRTITEEYIKNPEISVYRNLRKKMFEENKDVLIKAICSSAIESNVSDILGIHCRDSYYFNWQWHEKIAKFIIDNFELFENNENFNFSLKGEIKKLKYRIEVLEEDLKNK